MDLSFLYQELIIDHGTNPRNFCVLENHTHNAKGLNPLCGDNLEIFLEIKNDKIIAASFKGQGCAISTASASILTEVVKNKKISEASQLFKSIQNYLKDSSDSELSDLEDLQIQALCGVKNYPTRIKCAILAWHALNQALNGNKT